jgi:NAD(P)H dehydrogenase (quinone)
MHALKISVVYQSSGGHTRALAEAVARGCARVPDVSVELLEITGKDVVEGRWRNEEIFAKLDASDAIVFGCATYMGSVSAIFKAFLETSFQKWTIQTWKDKFAAGFTNSASQNGDKLSSLIQLAIFAAQMGMFWVSVGDGPGNNWTGGTVNDINRLGSWLGAMGQSNGDQGPDLAPSDGDRKTAERLGERVALVTGKYNGRTGYVVERQKLF